MDSGASVAAVKLCQAELDKARLVLASSQPELCINFSSACSPGFCLSPISLTQKYQGRRPPQALTKLDQFRKQIEPVVELAASVAVLRKKHDLARSDLRRSAA